MFAGTLAPYIYMGITGKEYDPKTGLVFFGSRWYDPLAGRFIMPDSFMGSISLPQTLNRYAYALNNPVRFLDPTGHDTIWGYDIEGTAFGITSGGQEFYGNQTGSWDNYGEFIPGGSSGGSTGTSSSGGGSSSGGSSGGSSSSGGGGSSPPPPPPEGGSVQAPAVAYTTSDTSSLNSGDEQAGSSSGVSDATGINATGIGEFEQQEQASASQNVIPQDPLPQDPQPSNQQEGNNGADAFIFDVGVSAEFGLGGTTGLQYMYDKADNKHAIFWYRGPSAGYGVSGRVDVGAVYNLPNIEDYKGWSLSAGASYSEGWAGGELQGFIAPPSNPRITWGVEGGWAPGIGVTFTPSKGVTNSKLLGEW